VNREDESSIRKGNGRRAGGISEGKEGEGKLNRDVRGKVTREARECTPCGAREEAEGVDADEGGGRGRGG